MKISILIILLSILFIAGCNKDNSNPITSQSTLDGTFKTKVIYEYRPYRGIDATYSFSNGSFNMELKWYSKDTLSNIWINPPSIETKSGTYVTENNFLRLTDEYGTSGDDLMIYHYSLEGNKLTLNSAWDRGGIFNGSSNSLTGTMWSIQYSYYDLTSQRINSSTRQLFYNSDLSGMDIYNNLQYNSSDTSRFNYSIAGDQLSIFYQSGSSYIGIFKIINNKLYIYGKPNTTTNDDYWQFELYK